VIKFVSSLREVGGFLPVLWFPPPIKLTIMGYLVRWQCQQANGFNTNRDSRGDNFASKCVMYQWDSVYLNLHANPLVPSPGQVKIMKEFIPKWWIPTCGKMSS
jgi:hypothetical protein